MSALPKRETVRRLVELVPDQDLDTVAKMLRGLVAEEDPVRAAFRNAPLDDEEVTQEDIAALEESRKAVAKGDVYSHEEVMRSLGL